MIFSEPPTDFWEKTHAYSVVNVYSGSVATQLRWGGKLCASI